MDKFRALLAFLSQASHNRTLSLVLLLIVAAMVPLTVSVLQTQQEIRQRAAECPAGQVDGGPLGCYTPYPTSPSTDYCASDPESLECINQKCSQNPTLPECTPTPPPNLPTENPTGLACIESCKQKCGLIGTECRNKCVAECDGVDPGPSDAPGSEACTNGAVRLLGGSAKTACTNRPNSESKCSDGTGEAKIEVCTNGKWPGTESRGECNAACAGQESGETPPVGGNPPPANACNYRQTCFIGNAEGLEDCKGVKNGDSCEWDKTGTVDPVCNGTSTCKLKETPSSENVCAQFEGIGKFCLCGFKGFPDCKNGTTNPSPPSGQGRILLSNSTPQKLTCKTEDGKTVELNPNSTDIINLPGGNHTLNCTDTSSKKIVEDKKITVTAGTTTVQTISSRASGDTSPAGSCEVKIINKDETNIGFNVVDVTFKGTGANVILQLGQKGTPGSEPSNRFSLDGLLSPDLGDAFSAKDKSQLGNLAKESDTISVINSYSDQFSLTFFQQYFWDKKFKKNPTVLSTSTNPADFITGKGSGYWYFVDICDGKGKECTRNARVKLPKGKSVFFMCNVRDQSSTPPNDILICNGNPICQYNEGPELGIQKDYACDAWKKSCSSSDNVYYDAPGDTQNRLNIDSFYPTSKP